MLYYIYLYNYNKIKNAYNIQRITQGIYGRTYTYLNIRHINATQINGRGASLRDREDSSKSAGHSVVQQLRYVYKVEEL
jgi:hypothetical protein